LTGLSSADYYWLTLAVAHQSASNATASTSGGLGIPHIPGASSVANGDVRITYRDTGGGDAADLALSGSAAVAVSRLSWMRPFRSIQAQPFSQRGEAPDPWVPMSISAGWPY
jgi:hypothetical protein